MRRLKQTGELYSICCHSVKWLPENDHLKYPDSEPNCGLVFLFIRNLFTSTMCPCRQENVQDLHERHLRVGVNRHYRSFEVDFHPVYVLIVIVIEYLEVGNARVEVIA